MSLSLNLSAPFYYGNPVLYQLLLGEEGSIYALTDRLESRAEHPGEIGAPTQNQDWLYSLSGVVVILLFQVFVLFTAKRRGGCGGL